MLGRFRASQYRYSRLSPTGDKGDDTLSSHDSTDELTHHLAPSRKSRIPLYATAVCVLCTITNLCILIYSWSHPSTVNLSLYELQSPLRTDLTNLRRPSQFLGLDMVERPSPPIHKEIINFPFIVGRVDRAHPQRVVTGGRGSRRISTSGIEARKVEAKGSIETVIQFRMIDWGMELCTLRIRLPSKSDTRFNANVTLDDGHNAIEIYRLESNSLLNLDSLTFHTRPGKSEKLGTINAVYDMDWNYDFPCEMDTLHAFTLVPSNDKTSVEWWQDKQAEYPAVYIIQHSTI